MSDLPAAPKLEVRSLQEAFAAASGLSQAEADASKLAELASQAPVIRLVESMLSEAVNRRASDVHIEAFEQGVLIRYRIDGLCYHVANPPRSLALAIASRIKILSNLDVAESRLPQDGRILITHENRPIDLRVSTLPTIHGESIVLRVLDKSTTTQTLQQLGMAAQMQQMIDSLIHRPHGLLLVTGPTGSGKTTTLYACLASLNRPEVKIVTTEDPVEYDVAGLVQVAISQKIALDFSTCLRAILRHDPDIIMVGEIRDPETAQVAMQAALTGHLVFSTLHTNDAPGAVTRLIDMGIEPFLITSTVEGVLAQRLVRRLCPSCRTPVEPTEAELAALRMSRDQLTQPVMGPKGCEACQGLGFKGRIGLFELLLLTEELRPLILERASLDVLRTAAHKTGWRTLRDDGMAKMFAGETTIQEIVRETQEYA